MRPSLARRLFRTILAIGLVNVAVTLVAIEFIYEDIEETNLSVELAQERAFFQERITGGTPQTWRTALLTALYLPDDAPRDDLPPMFRNRSAPYAAEVDLGDKTYLVSIERSGEPPGTLFLAQDISVLEDREDLLQEAGIAAFALCMLLLSFLLARFGTRRIVRPLQTLTGQIAAIDPAPPIPRIPAGYSDRELAEIAQTLNGLLEALDAYVRREKALVSLASHELRTPLAVIAGALDVLEQRGSLAPADRRTLERIRRAADGMQADVDSLLKLARRPGGQEQTVDVDLAECVRRVVAELESGVPGQAGRVTLELAQPGRIRTDPALVRMLLRNLIQNALRHTEAEVEVRLAADLLTIADQGAGLPPRVRDRLAPDYHPLPPEEGLGLFIVRLICERLGWVLQVRRSGAAGTVLELSFQPAAPPAVADGPRLP